MNHQTFKRLTLLVLTLCVGIPTSRAGLLLYLDIDNQQMSFVGVGPYTDLVGDSDYEYKIRLRTEGSTTGLFYSQNLPDGFVSVGDLESVRRDGSNRSSVLVRSNGRVLDITLAFPEGTTTEGYLTAVAVFDYSGSSNFAAAIGDGSGLTSRTLTPYMPDPDATFPYGADFEIPIVTSLPVIPEPPTIMAAISAVGLAAFVGYRRLRRRRVG